MRASIIRLLCFSREKNIMANRFSLILSLLLALGCSNSGFAQTKSVDAEGHQWWQHTVFYEIYPRSFADNNNDGIGDLKGITSKMGYLQDLGVDSIWISPCFPSPQVDFGYDVSDYENIDPMYGTLDDFDHMVAEGKKHNVSIILDFVVNHSSDKHAWFVDSNFWRLGVEARPRDRSVLLSFFLRRAARSELAQSCGRESHAGYNALVVQARRCRFPPGCGGRDAR